MKRAGLFIVSFLIGIYIWFPYRVVYTSVIDNALSNKPVRVNYTLSEVSPFKLKFKEVQAKYKGYVIKEEDLTVKINPLSVFLKRDIAAISKEGLFVRIQKHPDGYAVHMELNNYKDPNIPETVINGSLSALMDLERRLLREAKADLMLRNLSLKLNGMKVGIDEARLKADFRDGRLRIGRLIIQGPVNAQIKCEIFPDYHDLTNSKANLTIRYLIADRSFVKEFNGRLKDLYNLQSLLSRP